MVETLRQRIHALEPARSVFDVMPRSIVCIFLLQALRVTFVGGLIGLVLSAGVTRLLTGMLFGVSPLDPATYIGAFLFMVLIALTASLFPSLRAVRINPTEMLREE